MIRTALFLGLLVCAGCANPLSLRGYYRYPPGITGQHHLQIEKSTLSVLSLEKKQRYYTHPYEIRDGKIVMGHEKELHEYSPQFLKLINHRNKVYRKVLNPLTLSALREIE